MVYCLRAGLLGLVLLESTHPSWGSPIGEESYENWRALRQPSFSDSQRQNLLQNHGSNGPDQISRRYFFINPRRGHPNEYQESSYLAPVRANNRDSGRRSVEYSDASYDSVCTESSNNGGGPNPGSSEDEPRIPSPVIEPNRLVPSAPPDNYQTVGFLNARRAVPAIKQDPSPAREGAPDRRDNRYITRVTIGDGATFQNINVRTPTDRASGGDNRYTIVTTGDGATFRNITVGTSTHAPNSGTWRDWLCKCSKVVVFAAVVAAGIAGGYWISSYATQTNTSDLETLPTSPFESTRTMLPTSPFESTRTMLLPFPFDSKSKRPKTTRVYRRRKTLPPSHFDRTSKRPKTTRVYRRRKTLPPPHFDRKRTTPTTTTTTTTTTTPTTTTTHTTPPVHEECKKLNLRVFIFDRGFRRCDILQPEAKHGLFSKVWEPNARYYRLDKKYFSQSQINEWNRFVGQHSCRTIQIIKSDDPVKLTEALAQITRKHDERVTQYEACQNQETVEFTEVGSVGSPWYNSQLKPF